MLIPAARAASAIASTAWPLAMPSSVRDSGACLRAARRAGSSSSWSCVAVGLRGAARIASGRTWPCAAPKPQAADNPPIAMSNNPPVSRPSSSDRVSRSNSSAGSATHSLTGAAFNRQRSLSARHRLACASIRSTAAASVAARPGAGAASRAVQRLPIAGPDRVTGSVDVLDIPLLPFQRGDRQARGGQHRGAAGDLLAQPAYSRRRCWTWPRSCPAAARLTAVRRRVRRPSLSQPDSSSA